MRIFPLVLAILAPTLSLAAEFGIASWYGEEFDGRQSADGSIYDMEQRTAAHRSLPLGTRVRVTNLINHKSIDVRITDRGPFVDGRVIDLSRSAARAIDVLNDGVAPVRLEILTEAPEIFAGEYAVQVGAFRDRGNAERLAAKLEPTYTTARITEHPSDPTIWRVIVGEHLTASDAAALASGMRASGMQAVPVKLVEPSTIAANY